METMTDREHGSIRFVAPRSPSSRARVSSAPRWPTWPRRPAFLARRSTSTSTTAPTSSAKPAGHPRRGDRCRTGGARRRRPRRRAHRRLPPAARRRWVRDPLRHGVRHRVPRGKHEFAADVSDAELERGRDGLRAFIANQTQASPATRKAAAELVLLSPAGSKPTGHSPRSTANDSRPSPRGGAAARHLTCACCGRSDGQ